MLQNICIWLWEIRNGLTEPVPCQKEQQQQKHKKSECEENADQLHKWVQSCNKCSFNELFVLFLLAGGLVSIGIGNAGSVALLTFAADVTEAIVAITFARVRCLPKIE